VNALTVPAFDPVSKQPEFKHAAVQVEKAALPWRMAVLCAGDGAAMLDAVQPLLRVCEYAAAGLAGRDRDVLTLRLAHDTALPAALTAALDEALGLNDPLAVMQYEDSQGGISKRVRVDQGRVTAARLSGETAAFDWLKELISDGAEAAPLRAWVLAPVARPPAGGVGRGRIVCNCLDVAEPDIVAAIAGGADLSALQATLKCGSECGSCVPELKRLISGNREAA
jgi:assimilatory nitrate reductase catalytic subunit